MRDNSKKQTLASAIFKRQKELRSNFHKLLNIALNISKA